MLSAALEVANVEESVVSPSTAASYIGVPVIRLSDVKPHSHGIQGLTCGTGAVQCKRLQRVAEGQLTRDVWLLKHAYRHALCSSDRHCVAVAHRQEASLVLQRKSKASAEE